MRKRKNSYRLAATLEYERSVHGAPIVGARGEFIEADEIVRLARRYGVPVVEDSSLAHALNAVPVNEQIPGRLFEAVAILLHQIEANFSGWKGE